MTTVRGASVGLKFVIVCSTLSSKTLKCSFWSPLIGLLLLSVTTTSTLTKSTSMDRETGGCPCPSLLLLAGLSGTSGRGTLFPTSFFGPWAMEVPAAKRADMRTRSRSFVLIVDSPCLSLTDHTSAAQDFDLPLPALIDPDL